MNKTNDPREPQFDEFVEAYEAARQAGQPVRLRDFIPPRDHPDYVLAVAELVRVDIEYGWENHQPVAIEDYRAEFPDVLQDSECLERVAFEEYRMRRLAGMDATRDEYRQRFSISTDSWPELPVGGAPPEDDEFADSWFRELSRTDSQAANRLAAATRQLPKIGDQFLDFELVGELGRGAFGRVYLARQGDLANRFVALKITAHFTQEPERLAQLQHTNIVPIYSLHQHGRHQAVCMPFLGPNTLADVLKTFQVNHSIPDTGQALVSTMAARQASTVVKEATAIVGRSPADPPGGGTTLARLGKMSYLDAAAWILSRVADGLAHAHEHGIVHRDLKPANVLLTDDGEPLILDFNLSTQDVAPTSFGVTVGGTLPYMAPEHIEAVRGGGCVDARSDIYSLGIILFEMLSGRTPYPLHRGSFEQVTERMLEDRKQPAPPVRSLNRSVSPGLNAIVARCVAVDPADRYATARQLREDLQCQLNNRPLRYAPNQSLRELAAKWTRRHPRLSSASALGALATIVILTMAASLWIRGKEIDRGEARQVWQRFQTDLADARTVLSTPYVDESTLAEAVAASEAALEQFEVFDSADLSHSRTYQRLDVADRRNARRASVELLYLLAAGKAQQALRSENDAVQQQLLETALSVNALAGKLAGDAPVPQAVQLQRRRFLAAVGQDAGQRADTAQTPSVESSTDKRLQAFEIQQREPQAATRLLHELIEDAPQDYTLWFGLGNCYLSQQRYADAKGCYTTAIALRPGFTLGYDHRGLARLGLHEYDEARRDFDVVLSRYPDRAAAFVNRALAYKGGGKADEAIQDLTRALDMGATQTRIYFIRARLKRSVGDTDGATADRAQGIRLTPRDELSWIARGLARLDDDPHEALHDFRQALKMNPGSRPALQNIAHVLSEHLGKAEEAIEALEVLLALVPNDPDVLVSRGVLLARLNRRDEALADAEAAQETSSEAMIIYQAGCVYSLTARNHVADTDRAVQLIAQALKSDVSLVQIAIRDPDLLPLKAHADFQAVISAALALARQD